MTEAAYLLYQDETPETNAVSGKFRCATLDCAILTPNSQICVAFMVSAPIYVAQKQMSY